MASMSNVPLSEVSKHKSRLHVVQECRLLLQPLSGCSRYVTRYWRRCTSVRAFRHASPAVSSTLLYIDEMGIRDSDPALHVVNLSVSLKVDISCGNMMCNHSILHPSSLMHAHVDATGKTTGSLIPNSQDTSSALPSSTRYVALPKPWQARVSMRIRDCIWCFIFCA